MSATENLSKNDLIKKLREINTLYLSAINIKRKMDDFESEDTYCRKIVVPDFPGESGISFFENAIQHENDNAIEKMGELYKSHYFPSNPSEPKIEPFKAPVDVKLNNKQSVNSIASKVAAVIAGLFLIGNLQNFIDGNFLVSEALFALGVPAVCIILFFYFKKRSDTAKAEIQKNHDKALEEYNREKDAKLNQYNNILKEFEQQCQNYEIKKKAFLNEYSNWRKIYIQHLNEEAEIEEKLEADRLSAVNKIAEEEYHPAVEKLFENNDLIANEYLSSLESIIGLLTSNRADSLKEAINLFEDIVYRERQLELQREQEEQRRYEEERRYQEEKEFRQQQEWNRRQEERERQRQEERRYQEEKEFREKQERNRQQEERERQRQEDRRYRAEERARAEQKQNQDRATQRQCNVCAHVGHCSVAFTRPNCASFRPR